jgi:hypothetical protein
MRHFLTLESVKVLPLFLTEGSKKQKSLLPMNNHEQIHELCGRKYRSGNEEINPSPIENLIERVLVVYTFILFRLQKAKSTARDYFQLALDHHLENTQFQIMKTNT